MASATRRMAQKVSLAELMLSMLNQGECGERERRKAFAPSTLSVCDARSRSLFGLRDEGARERAPDFAPLWTQQLV